MPPKFLPINPPAARPGENADDPPGVDTTEYSLDEKIIALFDAEGDPWDALIDESGDEASDEDRIPVGLFTRDTIEFGKDENSCSTIEFCLPI
jgi:hypothetical protein